MNEKNNKIIISGGGTGGHIYPAISIANALKEKRPDLDILFVGAMGNMEMQKVPAAGYPIEGLPIMGFKRKGHVKNFKVFIRLLMSLQQAKRIIKRFNPGVVVGVGGYASGPILRVATACHIPTLIQEQNCYAGVTNRILSKKVNKICVAFDGMSTYFPADKIILTGNPVRKDLENVNNLREEAIRFYGLDDHQKTLLVLGGSQGAKTINECMMTGISSLITNHIQVIWQTGSRYYPDILHQLSFTILKNVKVFDFIFRMDLAYAAADLVISRSGASTISELCLVAKPAILIPSPNVAEDHQTKNAMALVDREAAKIVSDEAAKDQLIPLTLALLNDNKSLQDLSSHISGMAKRDSAMHIADEVLDLIK